MNLFSNRSWIGIAGVLLSVSTLSGGRGVIARADGPARTTLATQGVPEFPAGLDWLNTDHPLTLAELKGKVVLLDFWTYCCINCIHIMPTLKKLEQKYPNELVVIGVHSAKFKNEKESRNIKDAVLRYELEHPVVNDNKMEIWQNFGVEAWPTIVIIAPDGKPLVRQGGEVPFEALDEFIGKVVEEHKTKGTLKPGPIKWALERDKMPKSALKFPGKITAHAASNRLFIADSTNHRIVISDLDGKVQEVVGSGKPGLKNGSFSSASFSKPQGLYYDAAKDCIYVADTENHAIRKIDMKEKSVSTLAGTGKQGGYPPTGGKGTTTRISSPWDVLKVNNKLFVAMAGTHQIWTYNLDTGIVNPYAGTGGENIKDGPAGSALLAQPSGLAFDGQKRLFFADSEVSAVRELDVTSEQVRTLIGTGLFDFGDIDGVYPTARLQHPLGVAYHDGWVYVADAYNHKIRRIDPKTRKLESFIGTGQRGFADGAAKEATLNEPNGLVFVNNKIYIADTNNSQIRVFDLATNRLSTLVIKGEALKIGSK